MKPSASFYGTPVRNLQTMLRALSDRDPQILPVIPDGFYGGITAASVRSFQEANNLPVTGAADLNTWNAIAQAFSRQTRTFFSPQMIWDAEASLHARDTNLHLNLAKAIFSALSHHYPALLRTNLNPELDPHTVSNLRWIQRAGNLTPTGILDRDTWHLLMGLYHTVIGNGAVP